MGQRALITTGALALAGLGIAGAATAVPVVTGVEVTRTGKTTLEVDVETERGAGAAQPRLVVSSRLSRISRSGVRRATVRARARIDYQDWAETTHADDPLVATATIKRVRQPTGKTIRVRVRACDVNSCVNITRRVSVLDEDERGADDSSSPGVGSRSSDGTPPAPLPPGAIDADGAVRVALSAGGAGSAFIGVERGDEYGAAWEVRVHRADGARLKVYVSADGAVVRMRVDSGAPGPVTPPPADAIGPDKAGAIALAHVGEGSSLLKVEREDDPGVAWEVKVRAASGLVWEIKISASGAIVEAEIDD